MILGLLIAILYILHTEGVVPLNVPFYFTLLMTWGFVFIMNFIIGAIVLWPLNALAKARGGIGWITNY